ncbi:papilin-like [Anticarsia gemmatalis]|uniref:papilin-like n=1 Tax=Anticarsia gemmatalis TaxID=129554 RepID=UPI003F75ADB0
MTAHILRSLLLALVLCNLTWGALFKTRNPDGYGKFIAPPSTDAKCPDCKDTNDKCHNVCGFIDTQDLDEKYTILLIPAGSTNITIEEIKPSTNNMVVRNVKGRPYIEGHVRAPASLLFAGTLWLYQRSTPRKPVADKLRAIAPTKEPLFLSLHLEQENVGIQYKYCVPKTVAPPTTKKYTWEHEEFTPCSASCGGGSQIRNVTCRASDNEIVGDNLCIGSEKPLSKKPCNEEPCPMPAEWVEGPWSNCSEACRGDGISTRDVICQKIIAKGYPIIVPDFECIKLHGPKPEVTKECNREVDCPNWYIGNWTACSQLCDEGNQTRDVVCRRKVNNRVQVLSDEECGSEKPAAMRACMNEVCQGLDWAATKWSGCDSCFSKIRSREVSCMSESKKVYNDSFCDPHKRPVTEEPCDPEKLPPCQAHWYATLWSKCSVDCGKGVQTRKVFCGQYRITNVTEISEERCAKEKKLADMMPCEIPLEQCPSQWFAGPWGKCSKACGGGIQHREVKCLKGGEPSSDCSRTEVPLPKQSCNTEPCRRRKRSHDEDARSVQAEIEEYYAQLNM